MIAGVLDAAVISSALSHQPLEWSTRLSTQVVNSGLDDEFKTLGPRI